MEVIAKIVKIYSVLSKIVSYACNIKTKQAELFLIINQKEDLLSWYKSENQNPFFLETKGEIARLEKPDIISIRYRPITQFRHMIEPVLYALISPQKNLARSFLSILVLANVGFFGWAALKGQSVTPPIFVGWFTGLISFISTIFSFAFFALGLEASFKALDQIGYVYWEKHNFSNSLWIQALMIGVMSLFIPKVVYLIAINL